MVPRSIRRPCYSDIESGMDLKNLISNVMREGKTQGNTEFEVVHASRGGRRERTKKCDAIDCKSRVRKGQELCSTCQKREEELRKSYAIW